MWSLASRKSQFNEKTLVNGTLQSDASAVFLNYKVLRETWDGISMLNDQGLH